MKQFHSIGLVLFIFAVFTYCRAVTVKEVKSGL